MMRHDPAPGLIEAMFTLRHEPHSLAVRMMVATRIM
jgi:hypothetical protein